MRRTLIIILNWNNSKLSIDLAERIRFIEEKESPTILIIDNNSSDDEKGILMDYAHIRNYDVLKEGLVNDDFIMNDTILFLNKNYGYAKGNNFGLRLAKKSNFQFSLISNNDIVVNEPVLEQLIESLLKSEKNALVGPRIVDKFGKQEGPFKKPGMFYQFWYLLFYPIFFPITKILNTSIRTNNVLPYRLPGSFLLFKTSHISEIGFFDENTFLYAEELIIAEKLERKGYKTIFCPEVSVMHYHEGSTKKIDKKRRFEYHLASDLYYFSEYRQFSKGKIFLITFSRKVFFYLWEPIISFLQKHRIKGR